MLRAVPHTPVTSAPSTLAIWTAMVPTPPEAPLTRTRVPAPTCATSRMATSAASPVITDAAASVNVSPAGFPASWAAGTTTYWANAPARSQVDPSTSSPGTRSVTRPPTASTTPATSLPRTARFGRRSPEARRPMYGTPVTVAQSGVLTLVARTRTRTSPAPTGGTGISSSRSTRSGAP